MPQGDLRLKPKDTNRHMHDRHAIGSPPLLRWSAYVIDYRYGFRGVSVFVCVRERGVEIRVWKQILRPEKYLLQTGPRKQCTIDQREENWKFKKAFRVVPQTVRVPALNPCIELINRPLSFGCTFEYCGTINRGKGQTTDEESCRDRKIKQVSRPMLSDIKISIGDTTLLFYCSWEDNNQHRRLPFCS